MGWTEATFVNRWVRIHILDTVTSVSSGASLDGEICAISGVPASGLALDGQLPSGDGVPGGTAMFVVGTLIGDVNGNGIVNSFDRLIIKQNQGGVADIPSDVDGNGIVNSFDVLRCNQNQAENLPSLPLP